MKFAVSETEGANFWNVRSSNNAHEQRLFRITRHSRDVSDVAVVCVTFDLFKCICTQKDKEKKKKKNSIVRTSLINWTKSYVRTAILCVFLCCFTLIESKKKMKKKRRQKKTENSKTFDLNIDRRRRAKEKEEKRVYSMSFSLSSRLSCSPPLFSLVARQWRSSLHERSSAQIDCIKICHNRWMRPSYKSKNFFVTNWQLS